MNENRSSVATNEIGIDHFSHRDEGEIENISGSDEEELINDEAQIKKIT